MKKILTITSTLLLVGCATGPRPMPAPIPMPAPAPVPSCDYKVAGKCKHSSAADVSGNTTLGNKEDDEYITPKAAAVPP